MVSTNPNPAPNPALLFNRRQMAERHPHLLPLSRMDWSLRHRETNGLTNAGAVFESPCGEIFIYEPKFLEWFLGLGGRAKPRRLRARSEAVS